MRCALPLFFLASGVICFAASVPAVGVALCAIAPCAWFMLR